MSTCDTVNFTCIEKFRVAYGLWRQMHSVQYRLFVCFCTQVKFTVTELPSLLPSEIYCNRITLIVTQ